MIFLFSVYIQVLQGNHDDKTKFTLNVSGNSLYSLLPSKTTSLDQKINHVALTILKNLQGDLV